MTHEALIIGHADPDGHVIVEQCRRSLAALSGFEVTTLVDSSLTADHKMWLRLNQLEGAIAGHDYVFFVDVMFSPKTFVREAEAFVEFAKARPTTQFVVLDHHPLPRRRLYAAKNVRAVYRSDVYDCALGPPSPLMILAAACEKQKTRSKGYLRPDDTDVVTGLMRAGARGSPIAGRGLLEVLRRDAWSELAELGKEPTSEHRRPRGNYAKDNDETAAMRRLRLIASHAASNPKTDGPSVTKKGTNPMVYDFSASYEPPPDAPAELGRVKVFPRDLEAIATAIELAAITLSYEPDAVFTKAKLVETAREFAEPTADLRENDIDIVLGKLSVVEKSGENQYRLKSI